jgi:hypothetical protein
MKDIRRKLAAVLCPLFYFISETTEPTSTKFDVGGLHQELPERFNSSPCRSDITAAVYKTLKSRVIHFHIYISFYRILI